MFTSGLGAFPHSLGFSSTLSLYAGSYVSQVSLRPPVAEVNLEFLILLLLPPECWDDS